MDVSSLNGLIDAIERLALPTWVRESPSVFAFTQILTWHAVGLSVVVGLNTVIALRLLGFVPAIPLSRLRSFVPLMYSGLIVNAVSGALLLLAALHMNLKSIYFLFKMIFIALAVVNLEFTRRRVFTDPALARNEVPVLGRRVAWLALVLWSAAIFCGRIVEYPGIIGHMLGID